MHSIVVSSGNDVKGSEKRRAPSVFKKNLNESKPSEHPPSEEKMSKDLPV